MTITYFHGSDPLDVDNIPKPILDALKGLVYSDDSHVSDLLCRKRDLSKDRGFGNRHRLCSISLLTPNRFSTFR